jgi:hypothetical protein
MGPTASSRDDTKRFIDTWSWRPDVWDANLRAMEVIGQVLPSLRRRTRMLAMKSGKYTRNLDGDLDVDRVSDILGL